MSEEKHRPAARANIEPDIWLPGAREAFEAWFSDDGKHPRIIERSGDSYVFISANSAWGAYWAAWGKAIDSDNNFMLSVSTRI